MQVQKCNEKIPKWDYFDDKIHRPAKLLIHNPHGYMCKENEGKWLDNYCGEDKPGGSTTYIPLDLFFGSPDE